MSASLQPPTHIRDVKDINKHIFSRTKLCKFYTTEIIITLIILEYIKGSLQVAPLNEKLWGNRLYWYVFRRNEENILRRV